MKNNIKLSIGANLVDVVNVFSPPKQKTFMGIWACINGLATSHQTYFLEKEIYSVKQPSEKSLLVSRSSELSKKHIFFFLFISYVSPPLALLLQIFNTGKINGFRILLPASRDANRGKTGLAKMALFICQMKINFWFGDQQFRFIRCKSLDKL